MYADTIDALNGFDGVWRRVTGAESPEPSDLCALIDKASRLKELYCALARRCPSASARFSRMAAQECALIRRLTAENFLQTGCCCAPSEACALVQGTLCALRCAYLSSCELAEDLKKAAANSCGELCTTLKELYNAERRRSCELRELILRAMGANCT